MTPLLDPDEFERILRLPDPPLPDAGFTRGVLASLPHANPLVSRRQAVLIGMTLLGCALGLTVFLRSEVISALTLRQVHGFPLSRVPWNLLIGLSMTVWWVLSVLLAEAISITDWFPDGRSPQPRGVGGAENRL